MLRAAGGTYGMSMRKKISRSSFTRIGGSWELEGDESQQQVAGQIQVLETTALN